MAENFESAQSTVKEKVEDVKNKAADVASGAKDRVANEIGHLGDQLDARVNSLEEDVINQIRARPLLSLGIAFGAGVVLGQMFGGNSADDDRSSRHRKRREPSFLQQQLTGTVGKALVGSISGVIANEVKQRIAGAGVRTEQVPR